MSGGGVIDRERFESLLSWLDPDRTRAGEKYEHIRRALIRMLVSRGSHQAEDLADLTIDRVSKKLPEIRDTYVGDPALYFHGVAQLIFRESVRVRTIRSLPPVWHEQADETALSCLDECLATLSSDLREAILIYYTNEKRAKIDKRNDLARSLGISVAALRVRMHRTRAALERCVRECLARKESS